MDETLERVDDMKRKIHEKQDERYSGEDREAERKRRKKNVIKAANRLKGRADDPVVQSFVQHAAEKENVAEMAADMATAQNRFKNLAEVDMDADEDILSQDV